MSEEEREQREEQAPAQREETMKDLDIPEEEGGEVVGGKVDANSNDLR